MRWSSCLLLSAIFYGCTKRSLQQANLTTEKGIIISRQRCSCINRDFDNFLIANKDFEKKIAVYADTNGYQNPILKNIHPLRQSLIDTMYPKNFNAVLFRKTWSGYNFRIIQSGEESFNMNQIMMDFFGLDSLKQGKLIIKKPS